MRVCGIDEAYITGNADDYEKFEKWAYTVQRIPGNPLYHWVHLELKRYFGIDEPFCPATARAIWDACNAKLAQPDFDAVGLLTGMDVCTLCTTDEPAHTLEWHMKIAKDDTIPFRVLPSYRPDGLMHIESPDWPKYIAGMGERYGVMIEDFDALTHAVALSIAPFQEGRLRGQRPRLYRAHLRIRRRSRCDIQESQGRGDADPHKRPPSTRVLSCGTLAEQYCENRMVMQLH